MAPRHTEVQVQDDAVEAGVSHALAKLVEDNGKPVLYAFREYESKVFMCNDLGVSLTLRLSPEIYNSVLDRLVECVGPMNTAASDWVGLSGIILTRKGAMDIFIDNHMVDEEEDMHDFDVVLALHKQKEAMTTLHVKGASESFFQVWSKLSRGTNMYNQSMVA